MPVSEGGTDDVDNLALACFHCNRRKANLTHAIDPGTGSEVPLFNPRMDVWQKHFIWSTDGLTIIGLTPTGRATIYHLNMNRERVVNIRLADKEIGRHPPSEDPIEKVK